MSFKVQIENELNKKHWNIILIDSLNEWWEDEHWKIQWKHSKGLEIYIQFLVDPMRSEFIYEVRAIKDLQGARIMQENESEISIISMTKRKFNLKLETFISEIETYRKNHENKNTQQTL